MTIGVSFDLCTHHRSPSASSEAASDTAALSASEAPWEVLVPGEASLLASSSLLPASSRPSPLPLAAFHLHWSLFMTFLTLSVGTDQYHRLFPSLHFPALFWRVDLTFISNFRIFSLFWSVSSLGVIFFPVTFGVYFSLVSFSCGFVAELGSCFSLVSFICGSVAELASCSELVAFGWVSAVELCFRFLVALPMSHQH